MIVEAILSTLDEKGRANFAPMGIGWGEEYVTVRPFRSTDTCRNLLATGYGVVNLTDDIMAYVQTALYGSALPHFPARVVPGVVYDGTCSWRELNLVSQAGTGARAELWCRVLHKESRRDFLGFCRARNAVIEAAILATRLSLTGQKKIAESLGLYGKIVQKTGGDEENQAFRLIESYVRQRGEQ
jgi:hypothetical protein